MGELEWDLRLPRRLSNVEAVEYAKLSGILSTVSLSNIAKELEWSDGGTVFTVKECHA